MPPAVTILQLKEALEPITREVNDMREEMQAMRKIITGNGSGIGLDEQVRNNRRDIDRHELAISMLPSIDKRLEKIEDSLKFQGKLASIFFVSAGGYVIVEVVKVIIKLL